MTCASAHQLAMSPRPTATSARGTGPGLTDFLRAEEARAEEVRVRARELPRPDERVPARDELRPVVRPDGEDPLRRRAGADVRDAISGTVAAPSHLSR